MSCLCSFSDRFVFSLDKAFLAVSEARRKRGKYGVGCRRLARSREAGFQSADLVSLRVLQFPLISQNCD